MKRQAKIEIQKFVDLMAEYPFQEISTKMISRIVILMLHF